MFYIIEIDFKDEKCLTEFTILLSLMRMGSEY